MIAEKTHQKSLGQGAKQVSIPNVCDHFDIGYMNTFEMLEAKMYAYISSQKMTSCQRKNINEGYLFNEKETKIGYEINFAKYFYKYQAPRSLEEITKDIMAIEQETQGLLNKIINH